MDAEDVPLNLVIGEAEDAETDDDGDDDGETGGNKDEQNETPSIVSKRTGCPTKNKDTELTENEMSPGAPPNDDGGRDSGGTVDILAPSTSSPRSEASRDGGDSSGTERGAGSAPPSFTLMVDDEATETGRTLFVYKDGGTDSEVTLKVISMENGEDGVILNLGDPEQTPDPEKGHSAVMDDQSSLVPDTNATTQESNIQEAVIGHGNKSLPDYIRDGAYSCDHCEFSTEKKYSFLTHWVSHLLPDDNGQHHCIECEYSTNIRNNLRIHMKRHANLQEVEDGEIFHCPECDYTTLHKGDLVTHAKKHKPDEHFRCSQCDFSSIYRHSLLHHVSTKHERLRPYQCKLCPYATSRKQDLKTHQWIHSREKKFKCTECKYETQYKSSLKAHMNKHNNVRPFQCSIPNCDFSTTTKANVISHEKRHPLQCSTCNFNASNLDNLKQHECSEVSDKETEENFKDRKRRKTSYNPKGIENEEGKIEFHCEQCEFKSTNKASLKRHYKKHELDGQLPSEVFQCEHCSYNTVYKSSLKRHMARHSTVKPLKCGHCDYSAINMSQMHVHIAKHTGIKPFRCSECSYETANKQHLTEHMSKHSNVRYKCYKCAFTTAWRRCMTAHLKLHKDGKVIFPATRRPHNNPSQPQDTMPVHTSSTNARHSEGTAVPSMQSLVPLVTMQTLSTLSLDGESSFTSENNAQGEQILMMLSHNGQAFQVEDLEVKEGTAEDLEMAKCQRDGTGNGLLFNVNDITFQCEEQGGDDAVEDGVLVIVTNEEENETEDSSSQPRDDTEQEIS